MTFSEPSRGLTVDQRREVREWLRSARGRYTVERTAQLSGVPRSTVYDWNKHGIVVADFGALSPKQWSYRDLVFLRLTAWLRSKGMARPVVAERIASLRGLLAGDDELVDDAGVLSVRSDGRSVLINDEPIDRATGAMVLGELMHYIAEFDLTEPIAEIAGARHLWGPNLVAPSSHTLISPWVMAGDPCIEGTRLPTSTLYALHRERGLSDSAITRLYDFVTTDQVRDAIELEQRLRAA